MKTKKAIHEWWLRMSEMSENRHYHSFILNTLNTGLIIEQKERQSYGNTIIDVVVKNDKWKYPLRLTFSNNCCVYLAGF